MSTRASSLAFASSLFLTLLILAGCSQTTDTKTPAASSASVDEDRDSSRSTDKGSSSSSGAKGGGDLPPLDDSGKTEADGAKAIEAEAANDDDKYKAALREALGLRAQGKHVEALTALESAKAIKETDEIQREIDKEKELIALDAAAELAVGDIQTVLKQGNGEEAAKLAAEALAQYGSTQSADKLAALKRQADALVSGNDKNDAARADRFRKEADAALKDNNLRAAVIALEQAQTFAPDDDAVKKQFQDVRDKLQKYDDARQRAAELRKDPARLDDALALYKQAKDAWDTPQVAQDIDELQLAMQNGRDRVGVADFEVRGDVGIDAAGKTIADEILPGLRAKYDVVERDQIAQVQNELKLEQGDLIDSDKAREQVAKLTKVRYLVVGSVSRTGGMLVVYARLVDVQSGVIMQTAKIVAGTPDDLLQRVPLLAKQLVMSDQEKQDYDQQQAQQQQQVKPIVDGPLPAPPQKPGDDQVAPPPLIPQDPQAPQFGKVNEDDVKFGPAPEPDQEPAQVIIPVEQNQQFQQRSTQVLIEVGDNHFRRGRFREAFAIYELALTFCDGSTEIIIRLDRCRPLLPPDVWVWSPRPRIAFLNFWVFGDPAIVPPMLSYWTPECLMPYFAMNYDIVDRAELFWWMGRMGLTVRDVMLDPCARRWLARALNIRYFVFGEIHETASFVVHTHLVDAQYGYEVGSGRIHVHDRHELRWRLGELASMTMMDSTARGRYLRDEDDYGGFIVEARRRADKREFVIALELLEKALRLRPRNPAVLVLMDSIRRRQHAFEFERERKLEHERQQKLALGRLDRRQELMRRTELARLDAQKKSLGLDADARRRLEQDRLRAAERLVAQADIAVKGKNFSLAVQLFESAVGLTATDEYYRRLALARQGVEEQNAQRIRHDHDAWRDARQRDLDKAKPIFDDARKERTKLDTERLALQTRRDQAEYERLLDKAKSATDKGKHEDALESLWRAHQLQVTGQLKVTKDVAPLIADTRIELGRAEAGKKGKDALDQYERDLALEKERKLKAENEAKANRKLYDDALKQAQKDFADKDFAAAIGEYHKAQKLFATDVVLTGLKQAEDAQNAEKNKKDDERKKKEEAAARVAKAKSLLDDAKKLLDSKKYDDALKSLQEARRLDPDNIDVRVLLSKAEQGRSEQMASDRDRHDQASFQSLLDSGKANLKAKQYQAAVVNLKEAVRLKPNDAEALAALKDAETARDKQGGEDEATKKKTAEYEKLMQTGRIALAAKQYDEALKAFNDARKLFPDDKAALNFIVEAKKGHDQSAQAGADEAKKREEAAKRAAELKKALDAARTALTARDFDTADKQLAVAAKISADDPDVLRLQGDLKKARDSARADDDARKKRDEKIAGLVKNGKSSLAAKQYDDAVKAFHEASQLDPHDKTVGDLLTQAVKARDDAAASATDAQVRDLVAKARTAIKSKQFDTAGKLLVDAGKLSPRHPEVTKALGELADARRQGDSSSASTEDVAAKVKKLLASGRDSLRAGKFELAEKDFTDASKLAPKDPDVIKALKDLADARADGDKKRKDYEAAITQGQTAMSKKKYDDAIKAANDALKLFPGDKEATKLLADATKAKSDAGDAAKKQAEYDTLMTKGQTALQSKKYDDAISAAKDALKLFPGDKEATKLLNDATKAKTDAADLVQKKADFEKLLTQAEKDLAGKKYDDAIKAANEALKLFPGDKEATKVLNDATKAKNDAGDAAKKKADFEKLLTQAETALAGKKYDDAIKAANDALKLFPGDKDATKVLNDATKAKNDAGDAAKKKADFEALLAQGQAALAGKKYDDAIKAANDALKLFPGDKDATKLLNDATKAKAGAGDEAKKKADFDKFMTQGRAAVANKKYDDAIKAFTEALKLYPDDKDAQKAKADAEKSKGSK